MRKTCTYIFQNKNLRVKDSRTVQWISHLRSQLYRHNKAHNSWTGAKYRAFSQDYIYAYDYARRTAVFLREFQWKCWKTNIRKTMPRKPDKIYVDLSGLELVIHWNIICQRSFFCASFSLLHIGSCKYSVCILLRLQNIRETVSYFISFMSLTKNITH